MCSLIVPAIVRTAHDEASFAGNLLAEQQAQERGFARAARTGQEHELSLVDAQRELAQRVYAAAVHLGDLLRFDHDCFPADSPSTRRTLSWTRAGSAFPAVAFMTCPMMKPNALIL